MAYNAPTICFKDTDGSMIVLDSRVSAYINKFADVANVSTPKAIELIITLAVADVIDD